MAWNKPDYFNMLKWHNPSLLKTKAGKLDEMRVNWAEIEKRMTYLMVRTSAR